MKIKELKKLVKEQGEILTDESEIYIGSDLSELIEPLEDCADICVLKTSGGIFIKLHDNMIK